MDPKWRPCSGKWVSGVKIPQKYAMGEEKVKSLFASLDYISATIDIWSDRRMRGFMGITVHWMDKHNFEMHMACLAVIRIKGSHTGVNILEHFDNVMLKFNIKCKAVRIVSDGAANMRKAFELQLEVPADESEVLEVVEQREVCAAAKECIDSDEEMEDAAGSTAPDTESSLDTATFLEMEQLEEELSAKVAAMFLSSDHYKRVGCFNHALHNVVGDGLKVAGSRIRNVLAKVKFWVVLLHKSSKFFDCMEEAFGGELSLDKAVKTRWNSTVKEADSFLNSDETKFNLGVEKYGDKTAAKKKLNAQDRVILNEFIAVLELFTEATLRTEGDATPTINVALPLLLCVIRNLQEALPTATYCVQLIKGLLNSLFKRFDGALQLVGFKTLVAPFYNPLPLEEGQRFNDDIYLVAPTLDPTVKMSWVEQECVFLTDDEKAALKERIQARILAKLAVSECPSQPQHHSGICTSFEQPQKKSRLLQYRAAPTAAPVISKTPTQEMFEYLHDPDVSEVQVFWARKKYDLPKLAALVPQVLCVPASSSPIERVFSAAGYIMRPHRARLSYKTLQALIFLKVNAVLLKTI